MVTPIQRRALMLSLAGAVGVPVASRMLKTEAFDARQYYVYLGASGPYAVVRPPDETMPGVVGLPQGTFRSGQWLAYRSNVTVETNVTLVGLTRIVRLADQQVILSLEMRFHNETRREGERVFFLQLPTDLRLGAYEVRRRGTFCPDGGACVGEDFPAIPFEVVA